MGSSGRIRHISLIVTILVFAALSGCASTPSPRQQTQTGSATIDTAPSGIRPAGHQGLVIAHDMLGRPYRYGGASPRGFDCSGLVYYSYRRAGLTVPRTTTEQYRQSRRVSLAHLQPGDLVFFKISRRKPSHVGIYAGNGRFIHAPSSGKQVAYASLAEPYWETRIVGAGRFR